MWKKYVAALAGFGALVSTLAGCNKNADAAVEAAENRPKPVRVYTLGRDDIAEVLSYVADLQAEAEVRVFSTVPDRILAFPWEDGDEIKRGQRIALIRTEGLSKGLEQVEAQIEALQIQIKNAKEELDRSRELLKRGVITQATFDKIQAGYEAAQAQRRALEAGRGQLAVTAGNAVIAAPISGVIASKMVQTGDIAAPGVPLCRIMSVDKLKANIRMVEAEVPKVSVGQVVDFAFDAYPERKFAGKVTTILPYLDQGTRTNTVEVTLDNPRDSETGERLLKPGMFGRAELVVAMHKGVLVAPERALLLDNQLLAQQKPGETLRKAFVVKDGAAQRRLVRLGARKGSYYEVLEGLAEGDKIIVRGQHGLKEGQRLEEVGEEGADGLNGKSS